MLAQLRISVGRVLASVPSTSAAVQAQRFIRARWERPYLKDLYHRRQLLGADPPKPRSIYPNWYEPAELAALRARLGLEASVSDAAILRALTDPSFASRLDHLDRLETGDAADETWGENNAELVEKGRIRIVTQLRAKIAREVPDAPAEWIEAAANRLAEDDLLEAVAKYAGLEHLIRAAELPISQATAAGAFRALLATTNERTADEIVDNWLLPHLFELDPIEVYPVRRPLELLEAILKQRGASSVEPRLLHSTGVHSAEGFAISGIYVDKKQLSEGAGETVLTSVDLAARRGLLALWGLDEQLPGGVRTVFDRSRATGKSSSNPKSLVSIVGKNNRHLLEVESADERARAVAGPLDSAERAAHYHNTVHSAVGPSLTRRLRHKFSRGSLVRRSFRYLVKPRVYTVS